MNENIGEKIRAKRLATGITQEDLARMLRVTKNTIARWERGERHPIGLYKMAVEKWLRKGEKA